MLKFVIIMFQFAAPLVMFSLISLQSLDLSDMQIGVKENGEATAPAITLSKIHLVGKKQGSSTCKPAENKIMVDYAKDLKITSSEG